MGDQVGTDGQEQQNPQGGLLDDPTLGDEDQGQDGPDDNQGQQNGDAPTGFAEQLAAMEQRLAASFQSEMDRRINQVVTRQRQGGGGGVQQDAQQQPRQGSGGGTATPVPAAADFREARYAYQAYVNDEIRFLSADERAYAADLAAAALPSRLTSGEDPDQAGRVVAADVAKRVKSLRAMYERRVVSALQKKGALAGDYGRPAGQPNTQQQIQSTGGNGDWSKGEERAKQMFAHRFAQNQQQN